MKNNLSLLSCLIISIVLIGFRIAYLPKVNTEALKVTTWDALGYYMYLPATYIYDDEKELKWMPSIDSTYSLTGGTLYQATKLKNGHYVNKYLRGVSVLQTPFFLLAHFMATNGHYPADGFSAPYQHAIAWGCILYCILSIFLLKSILRKYFSDLVVALTLLLLLLASNFIQYVSIDSAQSHGYIFPLYVLMLFATIQWHENKKLIWITMIGAILGVACISRPTELVMLFIPLLWQVKSKKCLAEKLIFLWQNKAQGLLLASSFFIAILPQLLYWKRTSGSWIYDVGSKWDFLSPHFRVLFGWEKGWFIYTPVTILFVIGLFFLRHKPFQKSVVTFCLLNIYIIIAWHIWRYGASYSCRALVQSYPVFAFSLAASVEYILNKKWRTVFLLLTIYLIAVNIFQIKQYNQNILHYDEMNYAYYKSIYLNPSPKPLDMSLLDTKDILHDESKFKSSTLFQTDSVKNMNTGSVLFDNTVALTKTQQRNDSWLKVSLSAYIDKGIWNSHIASKIMTLNGTKEIKMRLNNPLCSEGKINEYEYFIKLDKNEQINNLQISVQGNEQLNGTLQSLKLTLFIRE